MIGFKITLLNYLKLKSIFIFNGKKNWFNSLYLFSFNHKHNLQWFLSSLRSFLVPFFAAMRLKVTPIREKSTFNLKSFLKYTMQIFKNRFSLVNATKKHFCTQDARINEKWLWTINVCFFILSKSSRLSFGTLGEAI